MNEKVQIYKRNLENQLRAVERVIAIKERSKLRLLEKLKDPAKAYAEELGGGNVRVSKIEGVEPVRKTIRVPKQNSSAKGSEDPAPSDEVPAPAPAAEKKESGWSLNPFK